MRVGVSRKIKSSALRVSVIQDVVRQLTNDAGFAAGLDSRAGVATDAEVQRALPLH